MAVGAEDDVAFEVMQESIRLSSLRTTLDVLFASGQPRQARCAGSGAFHPSLSLNIQNGLTASSGYVTGTSHIQGHPKSTKMRLVHLRI